MMISGSGKNSLVSLETSKGRMPAATIFLALTVSFGWGLVFDGRALSGGDIVNAYFPYRALIQEQLSQGHFPHWNPLTFGGRPLQADIQNGLFYPPNVIFWIMPLEWAFNLSALFHIWLGAWGMALWMGQRIKLPLLAWFAGGLYMWSGYSTTRLMGGLILFPAAMAWLPWMLHFWDRLRESAGRPGSLGRMVCVIALVLAMAMEILAGAPQLAFYAFMALGIYGLITSWRRAGDEDALDDASPLQRFGIWISECLHFHPIPILALGGAIVLSAGVCAVQLLPTSMFVNQSWDRASGASWDYIADGSFDPHMLLTFVAPYFYGDPLQELADPAALTPYWGGSVGYFETTAYMGALPMLLAFVFFAGRWSALRKGWLRDLHGSERGDAVRLEVFLLILLGLALLFMWGRHSPAFWLAYHLIPGFDRFRVPARFLLYFVFAISALSAWTLDRLFAGLADEDSRIAALKGRTRQALVLVVTIIGGALGVLFWRSVPAVMRLLEMPLYPYAASGDAGIAQKIALLEAMASRSALIFTSQWIVAGVLLLLGVRYSVRRSLREFPPSPLPLSPQKQGEKEEGFMPLSPEKLRQRKEKLHVERTQVKSSFASSFILHPSSFILHFSSFILRPSSSQSLAILLCLGELFLYGRHFIVTEPMDQLREKMYPKTERVTFLQSSLKPGERFLWLDSLLSWQVDQFQPELLLNRPIMHGLAQLRGYDPVNSRRYGLFMNVLAGQPLQNNPKGFMFMPEKAMNWPLLQLWDCTSVLSYVPLQDAALREVKRWEMEPGKTLYDFAPTTPTAMAFLREPVRTESDTPLMEIAGYMASPAFDPARKAILESSFPPSIPPYAGSAPLNQVPKVDSVTQTPNQFRFKVSSPGERVLVLAQNYYPGWHAKVDGQPVEVYPTNLAQCGVEMHAGEHEVEFIYQPRQFMQGLAISLVSLLLMLLVGWRWKQAQD